MGRPGPVHLPWVSSAGRLWSKVQRVWESAGMVRGMNEQAYTPGAAITVLRGLASMVGLTVDDGVVPIPDISTDFVDVMQGGDATAEYPCRAGSVSMSAARRGCPASRSRQSTRGRRQGFPSWPPRIRLTRGGGR